MWRSATCVIALLVCAVPASADERPTQEKPVSLTPREVLRRLRSFVTLEKGIDPNTPLKDALEFLAERWEMNIVINTTAFRDNGIPELEAQPVRLPKLIGVRASTILRMVLSQVNATMLVTPDFIEVIPASTTGLPLVHASFEDRSLDEILHELSERTDYTVALDAHKTGEKAKVKLTANFKRVPLDTAVRLLADMAGLKMVTAEKALYVTDKANAEILQQEVERAEKKTKAKEPNQGGM